MSRPLTAIVVLDLSRLLPGPFLTMALADLGADVIKIEAPGAGDYMRHMPPHIGAMSARFLAVNRGKRSIELDLKSERGRELFLGLVARADVVVESFRPGVMDRLGLSYQTLSERNPGLVLCSISGYGQTGPYRDRAGHDLNYVGTAGILAMSGATGSDAPAMPGVQIGDMAGGALWGLSGVLAALVGRQATGRGEHLDIAMTEGALALLAAEISNMAASPKTPTRKRATLNGQLAGYRIYRTKDGGYLSVAPLEPKFWMAFNQAIGRQGQPAEVGLDGAAHDEIAKEVQALIAEKTRDEWTAIFDAADCCVDAVLELDELADHPQHRARNLFFEIDTGQGAAPQIRLPIGEPSTDSAGPAHGEHTDEVLAEFGLLDDEGA